MPQLEAEVATRVMAHLAGRMGPKEIGEAVAFAVSELSLGSDPPAGCLRVTNLYVNPQGKLVVEYEDNK